MHGGPVVDVVPIHSHTAGAAWGPDDGIVFAALDGEGLRRVPAEPGGADVTMEVLTRVDRDEGEVAHGWPQLLPGGGGLVFTVGRDDRDPRLAWLAPGAEEPTQLAPADGGAFFVESGHLVYARRGEAFAVSIDLDTAEVGPITAVIDDVASSAAGYGRLGRSSLVASSSGRLVYVTLPPPPTRNRLVWVEPSGAWHDVDGVEALHEAPRTTLDGSRIAMAVRTGPFRRDLWMREAAPGPRRRLTNEAGDNHSPVWSVDGRRLAFASNREGLQQIYRMTVDDDPPRVEHWIDGDARTPGSWSAAGTLLFHEALPARGRDIWRWTGEVGDGVATVLLGTPANERTPALSGDERWLAYVSDAVDGDQVYVRRHPDGPEWRVSRSGGTEPVWSKDGRELYFRRGLELFAVSVGPTEPGAARRLFEGTFARDPSGNVPSYDVDGTGSRFLMIRAARPTTLSVLTGWEP